MARSREELVEGLRACVRLHEAGVPLPGLVSDLTEAIEFLDSLEEREEWRVIGQRCLSLSPVSNRAAVETAASYALKEGLGRLQSRTVTETPWTDVEEGTDGC